MRDMNGRTLVEGEELRSIEDAVLEKVVDGANTPVVLTFRISAGDAREIWRRVGYRFSHEFRGSNVFSRYVAGLIERDCGVDIVRSIRQKHDPLTDEALVMELIQENPLKFSKKQKLWLRLRAEGRKIGEISSESMRIMRAKSDKGYSKQCVSNFLRRLRDELLDDG